MQKKKKNKFNGSTRMNKTELIQDVSCDNRPRSQHLTEWARTVKRSSTTSPFGGEKSPSAPAHSLNSTGAQTAGSTLGSTGKEGIFFCGPSTTGTIFGPFAFWCMLMYSARLYIAPSGTRLLRVSILMAAF